MTRYLRHTGILLVAVAASVLLSLSWVRWLGEPEELIAAILVTLLFLQVSVRVDDPLSPHQGDGRRCSRPVRSIVRLTRWGVVCRASLVLIVLLELLWMTSRVRHDVVVVVPTARTSLQVHSARGVWVLKVSVNGSGAANLVRRVDWVIQEHWSQWPDYSTCWRLARIPGSPRLRPGVQPSRWEVRFPHWFSMLMLTIVPTLAVFQGYRRYCRMMSNRCFECVYDLTGNLSGICPECGTAIPESVRQRLANEVRRSCD